MKRKLPHCNSTEPDAHAPHAMPAAPAMPAGPVGPAFNAQVSRHNSPASGCESHRHLCKGAFTPKEEDCIREGVKNHGKRWTKIKEEYPQILGSRSVCSIRKHFNLMTSCRTTGPWTSKEDETLLNAVQNTPKKKRQ